MTLSGWNYRKSHTITSGTTLTNYQTKIRVYYGSGTDSSNTTYLNSKCNSDFSDIRFTTSDGDTLISYWIELIITGNYVDIWLKVPSISTTTIYIYYGNVSASSISSGDNTFLFFDDFSSLDTTSKWTIIKAPTTTVSSNGSSLVVSTTSSAHDGGGIVTQSPLPIDNYTIESSCIRSIDSNIGEPGWRIGFTDKSNFEGSYYYSYDLKNAEVSASYRYGSLGYILASRYHDNVTYGSSSYTNPIGVWNRVSIKVDTINKITTSTISYSGASYTLISPYGSNQLSSQYIQLHCGTYNTTSNSYVDFIALREYADIEPTHSTWGEEEILNAIILANFTYSISDNFVTFTDTSSSTSPIVSRFWDFGDGITDDAASVTHEYFAPATYNTTLSISNLEGFSDSITKSVVIPNQSAFWPQLVSVLHEQFPTFEPCEVKFQGVSTPSKYIETTSYLWDFGDSETSTLQDPFHVYNSSGLKTVTFTATNIYGSKSTSTTIDISANVKVYFSPNYRIGSNPLSVEFHDISVPQDEVLTRTWNFGDGQTSTSITPTHQYTTIGTYSPSLTVTYHGGTKSLTKYNSMIVGIQTRTLSDSLSFSESQEPLTIATFIDKIDFTEIVVPALMVLTDKLAYIQKEIPLTRGILETGKTFAFHLTEIGRKVFTIFDSYGRKIIKAPTYEDATGFYTCETILSLEDTLQFEEELTEQFPT